MTSRRYSVLFLCTGNSARSILAEAILARLGAGRVVARSAGSFPKGAVHPLALQVLREHGHDTSALRSKSWDEFAAAGAPDVDLVFTVCDNAAGEACPVWPGHPLTVHWGLPDPAAFEGPEAEQREMFRRTYAELERRIRALVALPLDTFDRASLQARLDEIDRSGDGRMHGFERLLSVWVLLCMVAGIALGRFAPQLARSLDRMTLDVDGAPVVSIPIAVCLFFMMYPIMVKIDFAEVVSAGRSARPVLLTLFVNWCIKPFTMFALASFFLGTLFLGLIGADATDLVKLPFGLDLAEGARYGAGQVVVQDGIKLLEIPLWRSYLAGCILLGIAPCTAMVLVWGSLARGSDAHTLVMVAINSLSMLVLYGVFGGFLLGVGRLPVPWQALLLSIGTYVALPLVAGFASRRWIIAARGERWFREKFLHMLTPITIGALLLTLVLLFSFKGDVILENPLTILWIAIPLVVQTLLIFALAYALAKWLGLRYADAAPTAMIGASNHFEVAIASAVMLFGLSSGAALATVVGVLIEVPLMLALVRFCLRTQHWFVLEPLAGGIGRSA